MKDYPSDAPQDTWQAMEGLVREGLVRSIGVSNFSARKLERLAGYATIAPAVCQVEMHPYFRNDALLAWCQSRGIHVTGAAHSMRPRDAWSQAWGGRESLHKLRDARTSISQSRSVQSPGVPGLGNSAEADPRGSTSAPGRGGAGDGERGRGDTRPSPHCVGIAGEGI